MFGEFEGANPGSDAALAVRLISTTSKLPLPPCAALITFSVNEQRFTRRPRRQFQLSNSSQGWGGGVMWKKLQSILPICLFDIRNYRTFSDAICAFLKEETTGQVLKPRQEVGYI